MLFDGRVNPVVRRWFMDVVVFIERRDGGYYAFFQKGDEVSVRSPLKPTKIDALIAAIRLMECRSCVDSLFPSK